MPWAADVFDAAQAAGEAVFVGVVEWRSYAGIDAKARPTDIAAVEIVRFQLMAFQEFAPARARGLIVRYRRR